MFWLLSSQQTEKTSQPERSTIRAQSPPFANKVFDQSPPGVQPVTGYEQAIAPGVVELLSNKLESDIGATIEQFPSEVEISVAGTKGF